MDLSKLIEALLYTSPKPLTLRQLQNALRKMAAAHPGDEGTAVAESGEEEITAALATIRESLEIESRPYILQEMAGGYVMGTKPDYSSWIAAFYDESRVARLSQPALETLAIIAFRQPISRADMEAVRGVAVDGVIGTLLERKLVKLSGRAETPGRALLYETTPEFLEFFGLKDLKDLPHADELRRLEVKGAAGNGAQPELPAAEAAVEESSEETQVSEPEQETHETGTTAGEDQPAGQQTAESA